MLSAQSFDGGLIVGGDARWKLRSFSLGVEGELRTHQWSSSVARFKIGASAGYSCWQRRLHFSLDYAYLMKHPAEASSPLVLYHRHRLSLSAQLSHKAGPCKLAYRVRFQATFADTQREAPRFNPTLCLRQRLAFSFSPYVRPLKFFASLECLLPLHRPDRLYVNQLRAVLGVDYRLSRTQTLRFYLRNDNEILTPNPQHILYLGFCYRFEK